MSSDSLKIVNFALKMKIVLIGYMGSGKSSVGKALAKELNVPFHDLDDEIEKKEQSEISKIFESRGEIYFRKTENNTLKTLLSKPDDFVLATGGGTPCYGDSLPAILNADNTLSVYLKTPIHILSERLFPERKQRPLVAHLDSIEKMNEFIGIHLFERSHFYNQANITIDAGEDSPETLAMKIKQSLL